MLKVNKPRVHLFCSYGSLCTGGLTVLSTNQASFLALSTVDNIPIPVFPGSPTQGSPIHHFRNVSISCFSLATSSSTSLGILRSQNLSPTQTVPPYYFSPYTSLLPLLLSNQKVTELWIIHRQSLLYLLLIPPLPAASPKPFDLYLNSLASFLSLTITVGKIIEVLPWRRVTKMGEDISGGDEMRISKLSFTSRRMTIEAVDGLQKKVSGYLKLCRGNYH
ncbi:unnamed protein product [Lactuca saligna]|uniref:Uncharacterized protein n=1 Tax=Lactuca saligna TaxID=75948 RepID=A0AA36E4Y1_LACSI|nr:unnamed protein product [Lactuca saligna]